MDINDQDIKYLLVDNNLKELLSYLNDDETFGNHETLVNLLLFLFYSEYTQKKDWVQDIVYVIENKIFDEKYLAPCVKEHVKKNKYLFENIKQQALLMQNNGFIKIYNYFITYDNFNSCISCLYTWCKEQFEAV